ncbi:MAG: hypothetical protein NW207_04805 [Cytophagales bacterium]|nr:hypothetical protein [Cytophagales bacterium]
MATKKSKTKKRATSGNSLKKFVTSVYKNAKVRKIKSQMAKIERAYKAAVNAAKRSYKISAKKKTVKKRRAA